MRVTSAVIGVVALASVGGGWIVHGQQPGRQAQASVTSPSNLSEVTKEQFDQWMTQYSNWNRWGKDDERGTLNLITPAKRKAAADLVKSGISVSLAREIKQTPASQPRGGGWLESKFSVIPEYLMENVQMEFHGSQLTHFDALCHRTTPGKVYNGNANVGTAEGCSKLAVTAAKDGIVTRGVLVDIPGTSRLKLQDVLAWEKRTGVKVSPGDALLLRTMRPGEPRTGLRGFDPSILPFLKERDVALIGSDAAQEGGNISGVVQPIHAFVLLTLGMNIIDNMGLDDLADVASRLKRWDFMLVVAPLRVQNGSGSAVNPVATF